MQSDPAQFYRPPYTITNYFNENQIITVNVIGFSVYVYSLDDGSFQSITVFEHVWLGEHTIIVRDVKGNTGCGKIVIDGVQTIDYPHYFTPNGDGIHETWNVVGLENQPFAQRYIFDQHVKFWNNYIQLEMAGMEFIMVICFPQTIIDVKWHT